MPKDQEHVQAGLGLGAETATALIGLRFCGDVWAAPAARIVFAGEPPLEVAITELDKTMSRDPEMGVSC